MPQLPTKASVKQNIFKRTWKFLVKNWVATVIGATVLIGGSVFAINTANPGVLKNTPFSAKAGTASCGSAGTYNPDTQDCNTSQGDSYSCNCSGGECNGYAQGACTNFSGTTCIRRGAPGCLAYADKCNATDPDTGECTDLVENGGECLSYESEGVCLERSSPQCTNYAQGACNSYTTRSCSTCYGTNYTITDKQLTPEQKCAQDSTKEWRGGFCVARCNSGVRDSEDKCCSTSETHSENGNTVCGPAPSTPAEICTRAGNEWLNGNCVGRCSSGVRDSNDGCCSTSESHIVNGNRVCGPAPTTSDTRPLCDGNLLSCVNGGSLISSNTSDPTCRFDSRQVNICRCLPGFGGNTCEIISDCRVKADPKCDSDQICNGTTGKCDQKQGCLGANGNRIAEGSACKNGIYDGIYKTLNNDTCECAIVGGLCPAPCNDPSSTDKTCAISGTNAPNLCVCAAFNCNNPLEEPYDSNAKGCNDACRLKPVDCSAVNKIKKADGTCGCESYKIETANGCVLPTCNGGSTFNTSQRQSCCTNGTVINFGEKCPGLRSPSEGCEGIDYVKVTADGQKTVSANDSRCVECTEDKKSGQGSAVGDCGCKTGLGTYSPASGITLCGSAPTPKPTDPTTPTDPNCSDRAYYEANVGSIGSSAGVCGCKGGENVGGICKVLGTPDPNNPTTPPTEPPTGTGDNCKSGPAIVTCGDTGFDGVNTCGNKCDSGCDAYGTSSCLNTPQNQQPTCGSGTYEPKTQDCCTNLDGTVQEAFPKGECPAICRNGIFDPIISESGNFFDSATGNVCRTKLTITNSDCTTETVLRDCDVECIPSGVGSTPNECGCQPGLSIDTTTNVCETPETQVPDCGSGTWNGTSCDCANVAIPGGSCEDDSAVSYNLDANCKAVRDSSSCKSINPNYTCAGGTCGQEATPADPNTPPADLDCGGQTPLQQKLNGLTVWYCPCAERAPSTRCEGDILVTNVENKGNVCGYNSTYSTNCANTGTKCENNRCVPKCANLIEDGAVLSDPSCQCKSGKSYQEQVKNGTGYVIITKCGTEPPIVACTGSGNAIKRQECRNDGNTFNETTCACDVKQCTGDGVPFTWDIANTGIIYKDCRCSDPTKVYDPKVGCVPGVPACVPNGQNQNSGTCCSGKQFTAENGQTYCGEKQTTTNPSPTPGVTPQPTNPVPVNPIPVTPGPTPVNPIPPTPTDGVCGDAINTSSEAKPSQNLCAKGTATDPISSNTTWNYDCSGKDGGQKATCQVAIPKPNPTPIDAVCGAVYNSCSSGNPVAGDNGTKDGEANWACRGLLNGKDAACKLTVAVVPPPTPVPPGPTPVNPTPNSSSGLPAPKTDIVRTGGNDINVLVVIAVITVTAIAGFSIWRIYFRAPKLYK
jgi:hypothetical protein